MPCCVYQPCRRKYVLFYAWILSFSTDISTGPGRWAILFVDRWSEKKRLARLWKHSERCFALRYELQSKTKHCFYFMFCFSLQISHVSFASSWSKDVCLMGTLGINNGQKQNDFKFHRQTFPWIQKKPLKIDTCILYCIFKPFKNNSMDGLAIFYWDMTW